MSAIKVKATQFSGTGKVFTRDSDGLAAILRGMLIDTARLKAEVAGVHDFIDNSTGVAGAAITPLPVPSVAIDATTAGGAQVTALNASIVKMQNADLVVANTLNEARALLGLPLVVDTYGTQAAADTIPAQDKVGTAASGNAAASLASVAAAMQVAHDNFGRLGFAANEVLTALGASPLPLSALGNYAFSGALAQIPATVAVASGPGAAALADVTAALASHANNLATLAAAWSAAFNQGTPGQGPLHVIAG